MGHINSLVRFLSEAEVVREEVTPGKQVVREETPGEGGGITREGGR